ncbi:MAG: hypothetical protein OEM78_12280, partial [Gammaproteobacteria bacterium]|nr:hypothetical protein [Gammaproteobacteria bacterium]
ASQRRNRLPVIKGAMRNTDCVPGLFSTRKPDIEPVFACCGIEDRTRSALLYGLTFAVYIIP